MESLIISTQKLFFFLNLIKKNTYFSTAIIYTQAKCNDFK